MKILFDHQIFSRQVYGGISRYFWQLLRHFADDPEIHAELSLRYSPNAYLQSGVFGHYRSFLPWLHVKGKRRLAYLLNQRQSQNALRKQDFEIFHPTYYDPYFLRPLGHKPFVLTVYDLTHERFPQLFSSRDRTAANKGFLMEKAAAIVAISENTKYDILKYYRIPEQKIHVIYLGGPERHQDKNPAGANVTLPRKYLLFVGDRWEYKNFRPFIQAMAPLLVSDPDLHLLCVGGGAFSAVEKAIFKNFNLADRISQHSVADEQLQMYYRQALVFVFPSWYEGFGLPLLEAFAQKCPVAASETGSLPEIGGQAAVYFDPGDVASMTRAVSRLLQDPAMRNEKRAQGAKRAEEFTWAKTVSQTKRLYRTLV